MGVVLVIQDLHFTIYAHWLIEFNIKIIIKNIMATTKITTNSLADSSVTSAKLANSISIGTLTITSGISGNVAFDTNTLFVDSVNNNVGIGTTTPNEKLTVSGNISASNNVYANGNKLAAETFAIAMAIAVG